MLQVSQSTKPDPLDFSHGPAPSPVHHVVIFPHMAQGHTIPLLDISKPLKPWPKSHNHHTPSNAPFISSRTNKHPISLCQ
ncbi:hypothetical protein CFP56_019191 [Quercus suber]